MNGMVLVILLVIILFVLVNRGSINVDQMYQENKEFIEMLKEKDFDFLAMCKYGENVDIDALFAKRIKKTVYAGLFVLAFVLCNFTVINLIIGLVIVYVIYRDDYSKLKSSYKRHLTQIDQLLPYYLKSIEILAQHYTIPVAISRSINTAPEVFKPGLRRMIEKIDAGDSTIEPYMAFANEYPVKDSVRMMRLLYRLSIGAQENKQEQLIVFSHSVSSLQNKSREVMYSKRLQKMEKKTMIMLFATGGGSMVVMLIAMLMSLSS